MPKEWPIAFFFNVFSPSRHPLYIRSDKKNAHTTSFNTRLNYRMTINLNKPSAQNICTMGIIAIKVPVAYINHIKIAI